MYIAKGKGQLSFRKGKAVISELDKAHKRRFVENIQIT
jgi:hypothetical protein